MKSLSIDEKSINFKIRGNIKVRDMVVNVPALYKGMAVTALFPISTKKAKKIIDSSELNPAEISFGKTLLSITLFDFYWSPIGPYTELVYSIPVFYKSKMNLPFFPLLMNKFLKNFGFFVIDIAQSTEIAIEHGNLLTGYPHNPKLIDVVFKTNDQDLSVEAYGDKKKILNINMKKPNKEKLVQESYMTYFAKEHKLFKIQMDIYGIESKIKECKLVLGDHELAECIKVLDVSYSSIETRYFRDVIEINPVTLESL